MSWKNFAGSTLALLAFSGAWGATPAGAAPITFYQDVDLSGTYTSGEQRTGGSNGNGGATYNYAFDLDAGTQNISGSTISIAFTVWDNNFILVLNGVTVVPLDSGDPAVFAPTVIGPWTANVNGLPRLLISLDQSAVGFAAARTSTSSVLTSGLVYAQPTINPVFVNGQNTITIVNPDDIGPDALTFLISGNVPALVPEPTTASLIGLGLLGLAWSRRR